MNIFEAICRAMQQPGFYPHPVTGLERRDTHISAVFLTGAWVYKLKKPVDLGFLNFTDRDDRRVFCEREIQLNRRLSHGIYQEVVEIYQSGHNCFGLEQKGQIVEYAVRMRQLPEAASLRTLLAKNKVGQKHMLRLARAMAAFYNKSSRNRQIDHFGRRDVIAYNMEENFRQLAPFVDRVLDREKWEFICQVSRSFLESRQPLFELRISSGRIRDGHGDLRTDHIYFYKGVQIIDCIEFNDRFRYGDVAVDLAFLYMDMEHLGHSNWGRVFLAAYTAAARDPGIYALIDFYAAYRAIVRLKVACLDSQEFKKKDIQRYMRQAYRYALQFSRPTLWIFCGLPASGKSSLAGQLADALSLQVIRSDQVRRQRFAQRSGRVVPFGQGIYRPEMRRHVYAQMLTMALIAVKGGNSVILDGTFSDCKARNDVRQLASDLDTNLVFVECVCRIETICSRLKQRQGASGLSDARLQHLEQLKSHFEPLSELGADIYLRVNTDMPVQESLINVLSQGFALKADQVKRLL